MQTFRELEVAEPDEALRSQSALNTMTVFPSSDKNSFDSLGNPKVTLLVLTLLLVHVGNLQLSSVVQTSSASLIQGLATKGLFVSFPKSTQLNQVYIHPQRG